MHPDLEQLIALEKADKEIARLAAEIATLPKRVAEIEAKLNDARERADAARHEIKSQEMKKRSLESEVLALQQKITKFRDQSLDVKTNEQYRALMHEIEFSEKQIRENEDKILEGMESAESLDKTLKAAEADLKTENIEIEKEKAHVRSVTVEDEKQLGSWNARRDEVRAKISPPTLDQYERVFRTRKGAIAEAIGQKCSACFVLLRPQKWNEIKTNEEIHFCDSCGRFVYYDPAHEPVAEARPAKPVKRKKPGVAAEEPTQASPELTSSEVTPSVSTPSESTASEADSVPEEQPSNV